MDYARDGDAGAGGSDEEAMLPIDNGNDDALFGNLLDLLEGQGDAGASADADADADGEGAAGPAGPDSSEADRAVAALVEAAATSDGSPDGQAGGGSGSEGEGEGEGKGEGRRPPDADEDGDGGAGASAGAGAGAVGRADTGDGDGDGEGGEGGGGSGPTSAEPGGAAGGATVPMAGRGRRQRRATILELDELDAAIAGAEDDMARQRRGVDVEVGGRRRQQLAAQAKLREQRRRDGRVGSDSDGSSEGGGRGMAVAPRGADGDGSGSGSSSGGEGGEGRQQRRSLVQRVRSGARRQARRYRRWVARSEYSVPWYHKRAAATGFLFVACLASTAWMMWAFVMAGHTGWAALALAMMALGTLTAGWSGEVAGGEPTSNCPYPRCSFQDVEERKLFWCCLGMCHMGFTGMVATILKSHDLRQIVATYRALMLLKVYHGLWQSLPIALLASYALSQMATAPRVRDDFTTMKSVAIVVCWLLSTVSTAVSVAVQRATGPAVDSPPMFRRLELPFSHLRVLVVSCAHAVLRMLLVFWFAAAYRGYMMLGLVAEAAAKFVFAVAYCPLQRFPTDRTAAAASLILVWTPMNLVAPYTVPQRFRAKVPVLVTAFHMFTDSCLLLMPTVPLFRPADATSMTGAPSVTHGLCWTCNSDATSLFTSCCTDKLAIWPFALLCLLWLSVYTSTYQVLRADRQTRWFDALLQAANRALRRWRKKVWRKSCGRVVRRCGGCSCGRKTGVPVDPSGQASVAAGGAAGGGAGGGASGGGGAWEADLAAAAATAATAAGAGGTQGRRGRRMTVRERNRQRARRKSRAFVGNRLALASTPVAGAGSAGAEDGGGGGGRGGSGGGDGDGAGVGEGQGAGAGSGAGAGAGVGAGAGAGAGGGSGAGVGRGVAGLGVPDKLGRTTKTAASALSESDVDDGGGDTGGRGTGGGGGETAPQDIDMGDESDDDFDGDDDEDEDGDGSVRLTVDHLMKIAQGDVLDDGVGGGAPSGTVAPGSRPASFRVHASGRLSGRMAGSFSSRRVSDFDV